MTLEEFLEKLDVNQLKADLKLADTGDSTEYDEDQPLVTIANMKNKGSVMNIALPGEKFKASENKEQVKSCTEQTEEDVNLVNKIALNNMEVEDEDETLQNGNKRSSMQRKAKMNHAFFSKNYSPESLYGKVYTKRRKTGNDEEVIVKADCETKI